MAGRRRARRGSHRRDPGAGTAGGELGESKTCPVCGLPFSNRRKWAARGLWPNVVYCSERCRRTGGAGKGG